MFEVKISADTIAELSSRMLTMGYAMAQQPSLEGHNAYAAKANEVIVDEQQVADIVEGAEKKMKETRSRKTKGENPTEGAVGSVQSEPPASVSTEDTSAATASTTPLSEAPKLTYAGDIVPCVLSAVEEHGHGALEAILASFGVTKASQLAEDRWPDLLSKIERLG